MGKRNGEKGDWVAVLEGAGHLPPGVYKRSRVAALLEKPGVRYRIYRTQADAQRGFGHLVSQNGQVPAGEYLASTDGSYKEGAGSASAVLLDPRLEGKGREVALARSRVERAHREAGSAREGLPFPRPHRGGVFCFQREAKSSTPTPF